MTRLFQEDKRVRIACWHLVNLYTLQNRIGEVVGEIEWIKPEKSAEHACPPADAPEKVSTSVTTKKGVAERSPRLRLSHILENETGKMIIEPGGAWAQMSAYWRSAAEATSPGLPARTALVMRNHEHPEPRCWSRAVHLAV